MSSKFDFCFEDYKYGAKAISEKFKRETEERFRIPWLPEKKAVWLEENEQKMGEELGERNIGCRMPLESPRKPTDAFKSSGAIHTAEE